MVAKRVKSKKNDGIQIVCNSVDPLKQKLFHINESLTVRLRQEAYIKDKSESEIVRELLIKHFNELEE